MPVDLLLSDAEQAELWQLWFSTLRETGTLTRAADNWAGLGTPVDCALVDGSVSSGGELDYEASPAGRTLYVLPGYAGAPIKTTDRVEVRGTRYEIVAVPPTATHQASPAYPVVIR